MHEAGYRALGMPWVYVPFAVERDLEGALRGMRALGIRGLGVSMPHKVVILPLLDRLDPIAARIGAVNTVVNTNGTLCGHNTDAAGAISALREVMDPRGARTLVFGAGGAARAVVFGLVDAGADVVVANRDVAKGRALAAGAGARGAMDLATAAVEARGFDVVINATPVGMVAPGEPTGTLVRMASLRPGMVVMDLVYKPVETALVHAARDAGATAIHGGRMLLHQAAAQFELYAGRAAPIGAMGEALDVALASK